MKNTHYAASALLGTALLLTACGGSDGTPPIAYVNGSDIPVSVTESPANTLAFAVNLQAMVNDTGEPLLLGDAVLATDDTAEPAAV